MILNPVVIRRMFDGRWYVCHAGSYQAAIGSKINGLPTRDEAAKLAESFGFRVVFHDNDPLQQLT